MARYLPLLFTVFVLIFYSTAQADFYKWEDENGNLHITDYPPPPKSGKKIHVYKDNSAAQREAQQEEEKARQKEYDVVIYTKNSCPDCDKARNFLKSKKIPFTEYNTDKDKEAAQKRKSLDDSDEAPFAIINKNQVYGFSEAVYNKVLQIKP